MKREKKSRTVLLTWLTLVATIQVAGADFKHPRVAELENRLTQNAGDYLQKRFPNTPFLVQITIDPMRRVEGGYGSNGQKSERLPYFEIDSEEVQDEWDDPQIPLQSLTNRVRKASVTIYLPSSIAESDVTEVKGQLLQALHLKPARDEILIERRSWSSNKRDWYDFLFAGSMIALALLGLFLFNRIFAKQMVGAISELKPQQQGSGVSAAPMSAPLPMSSDKEANKDKYSDFRFNDPIKIHEIVSQIVVSLSKNALFPNHQDIFELDRIGRSSPAELGAVLNEFPPDTQKKLFALSHHPCWLEAIDAPGSLSFESLNTFQKLGKINREVAKSQFEKLVILCWRLDEQLVPFLKGLPQDEAFSILAMMPKSFSVPAARKAFPGSWAAVLDHQYEPKPIPEARIKELSEQALRLRPLSDVKVLKQYRTDREIVQFLRSADLFEERDIYEAAGSDSKLGVIRPPFYAIMDDETEVVRKIVPTVGLDQWALALFNVPKTERVKVDQFFSDKQRFMFVERMKYLDANPPSAQMVGQARERIGVVRKHLLDELRMASEGGASEAKSEGRGDEAKESPKAA